MRLPKTLASRRSLSGLPVLAALIALVVLASGCGPAATAATQSTASPETSAAGAGTAGAPESTVSEGPAASEGEAALERPAASTVAGSAGTELFDSSVVHEITVEFAQEDYDAMIETYQESADKEWIEATVTIDGETYKHVGMRLKGNSSIMGLRQGGMGRDDTTGTTADTSGDATDTSQDTPARANGGPGQGFAQPAGGMGGDASIDAPETLPWLIDLDKNLDNQNHEGVIELAVRSNTGDTALNEAVALELLQKAGLASQEAVYVGFSVNGSEADLRLVIQNPDDLWMAENFDISGALYKAESTGDYSYRGDDPDSYDEVFDQEAGKRNADLTPLIDFLDFINNADDATFDAELPDRLDIEAFATYLAMQELIANSDDIDGPGNNSYLYYDTRAERFTVVAWDHNLAFGGMGGMGGFGGATVPNGGGGFNGQFPGGVELPDGFQAPGGAQFPGGAQAPGGFGGNGGPGGMGGFGGKSNILVERFMANSEWEQLYEERLAELRSQLYESDVAADVLAQWVAVLKSGATDLVDAATVDEEAARISRYFTTG